MLHNDHDTQEYDQAVRSHNFHPETDRLLRNYVRLAALFRLGSDANGTRSPGRGGPRQKRWQGELR